MKKISFIVVAFIMIMVLLITSCAQAASPTQTSSAPTTAKPTTAAPTTAAPTTAAPTTAAPTTAAPTTAAPTTAAPTTAAPAIGPSVTVTPKAGATILKAMTYVPQNIATCKTFFAFMDAVNKAGNGDLVIQYKGGSEAIAGTDQINSVKSGVIDIDFNVANYVTTLVPAAVAMNFSEYSFTEERTNGTYDYLASLMAPAGLKYLGRPDSPDSPFLWFSKKPINSLQDIKGTSVRATDAYKGLVEALGAKVNFVPLGDVYSALDSGLLNSTIMDFTSAADRSLFEVSKYVLDEPTYESVLVLLMNQGAWDKLSQAHKDIITNAAIEIEKQAPTIIGADRSAYRAKLTSKGAIFAKLSATEEAQYYKFAQDTAWAMVKAKASADQAAKLESLMRKK